jgi:hypothetical protein
MKAAMDSDREDASMAHDRDTEDPALLEQALGGDRDAFDLLIGRHLQTLRAVVTLTSSCQAGRGASRWLAEFGGRAVET